jgi:hypothetical protein
VKEDHAVAHFYAAICHESLGDLDAANFEYAQALHFLNEDSFWEQYVRRFNIPIREKAGFGVFEARSNEAVL